MQNLILHAWQPITNLKKHYVSDARVELNDEGLFIHLRDIDGNKVLIVYDRNLSYMENYVWAFRHTGDGPRNNLRIPIKKALERATDLNIQAETFYKVENSDFIEGFDQLAWAGTSEFPDVEHPLYGTMNDVIEVIADYEPKFIII